MTRDYLLMSKALLAAMTRLLRGCPYLQRLGAGFPWGIVSFGTVLHTLYVHRHWAIDGEQWLSASGEKCTMTSLLFTESNIRKNYNIF